MAKAAWNGRVLIAPSRVRLLISVFSVSSAVYPLRNPSVVGQASVYQINVAAIPFSRQPQVANFINVAEVEVEVEGVPGPLPLDEIALQRLALSWSCVDRGGHHVVHNP